MTDLSPVARNHAAAAGSKPAPPHLQGIFRDYFAPSAHAVVEQWYIHEASPALRQKFKATVKAIIDFDVEKASGRLRTTFDADVIGANAIFNANNGPQLVAQGTYTDKTIQWLSFASVADRNRFRESIGLVKPPSTFSVHRHDEDYDPTRKYWRNASQITDHRSLVCEGMLHKPSAAFDLPCETIARHPTQTGTTYTWKTGARRNVNVIQKAHDATFVGAPWGVCRLPTDPKTKQTEWISRTREDFADTYFLQDRHTRRFQNYNDNYIGLLSREFRQQERLAASSSAHAATSQKPSQLPPL